VDRFSIVKKHFFINTYNFNNFNESSQQFNEAELKLLNKGLSFVMKPTKPPTLDLVVGIETAIKWLPEAEQETIRYECSKVFNTTDQRTEKRTTNDQKTRKN
jgi:hypothetical protein